MDELDRGPEFGRPARRPFLMAAGILSIAALGLSGLYQGFRFTWRDYGTAPSYSRMASATTPDTPQPAPDTQPIVMAAQDDASEARPDRKHDDIATTDPAPASPLAATEVAPPAPVAPTAVAPPDRDAFMQTTAYSPHQIPPPEQPSPVGDPVASAPGNSSPGSSPSQPPP